MPPLPLREDAFTSRRRATFRSPTLSTTTNIPVAPVATPPIVVNPPVGGGVITTPGDDDDLDPRNDVVLPPTTGFGATGGFGGDFSADDAADHAALNALTPDIDLDLSTLNTIANNPLVSMLANINPVTKAIQLAVANLTSPGDATAGVGGQAEGAESVGADEFGTPSVEANVTSDVNLGAESVGASGDPGVDTSSVSPAEAAEGISFGPADGGGADAGDGAGDDGGEGVGGGPGGGSGEAGDGGAAGAEGVGADFFRGGKVHANRGTGFRHGGKVGTAHRYNIGGAVPPSMLPFNIGGVVQDIEQGKAGNAGQQQNHRAFSNGGEVPPPPQGAADPAGPDDQFVNSPNGMASIQAGEFVIPKEVVDYLGEKHFRNLVSNARKDLGLDTDAQANGAGASSGSGAQASPAVAAALPQPPVTAPGAPLDVGDGGLTLQPASLPIGNPAVALSDPRAPQAAPRQPDSTGFTF